MFKVITVFILLIISLGLFAQGSGTLVTSCSPCTINDVIVFTGSGLPHNKDIDLLVYDEVNIIQMDYLEGVSDNHGNATWTASHAYPAGSYSASAEHFQGRYPVVDATVFFSVQ